ncbi:hypothetical protein ACRRTK_017211 [Alexandromys fortis]
MWYLPCLLFWVFPWVWVQSEDPVEIQMSAGCDVYSENASESFLYATFQGEYILSFQGTSFQKAPDAPPWTELVINVLNGDQGTTETAQWLLYDICPKFVHGLLEAGKAELEKQGTEKPEVWFSSGLSPKHGHLQLVCHVSGFYPKPVWVMWMHGEQEQNSTQTSDYLPNADETWYLRATLDVEAGKEAGMACCVKHSSLGEQDIICHSRGRHFSMGIIIVLVLGVLVPICALICYVIYIKKRHSYQDIL